MQQPPQPSYQDGYYDQQTGQWIVTHQQQVQTSGYGYDEHGGYWDQYGGYHAPEHVRGHHWWDSWFSCCRSWGWGSCWMWIWGVLVFAMLVLGVVGFFLALSNSTCITMLMDSVTALTATTDSQGQLLAQLTTPYVLSASGALSASAQVQHLACGAVCGATLPADLTPYVGLSEVCVYAADAFAHTVTISAGAAFNTGDTVATFGGAVGDNFCFRAIGSTVAAIKSASGVTFS